MKRILITGQNSYIGTSFQQWLEQFNGGYSVDTIDTRGLAWKSISFAGYDAIFHVAGIAHVDNVKKAGIKKELYYDVNCDLTIELARKAKSEGVKQFLFMSSIIVYGESSEVNGIKVITENTTPQPSNFYGDSKLLAEDGIRSLQSEDFHVVILRPPMIYGKGSKGNYSKLSNLAKKIFLFPNIHNERSMLYIDHLCEFVRHMIDNKEAGVFYPQNEEYVCTSDLVKTIAEVNGKKLKLLKILNPFIIMVPHNISKKVFGSLVYEKKMSEYKLKYAIYDFHESVKQTERKP